MIISNLLIIFMLQPIMSIDKPMPPPPKNITIKSASANQFMEYCPRFHSYHKLPSGTYTPEAPVMLIRIKDCMNTKDIIVISWIGKGSKLEFAFANLVVLHYSESQKSINIHGATNLITVKSKKDARIENNGMKVWYAIYDYKLIENTQ